MYIVVVYISVLYRYFLDIPDIYGSYTFREAVVYGKPIRTNCRAVVALSIMYPSLPATYLQNMSGGVSQECLKKYTCLEQWKCFFAPVSITFVHLATGIALLQH